MLQNLARSERELLETTADGNPSRSPHQTHAKFPFIFCLGRQR